MPPQIFRLVLLTVLLVGSYFVARYFMTPETYGQYGDYRGAALLEIAALQPKFAGAKACNECHGDASSALAEDRHRTIGCESCHGPGGQHVLNPDRIPARPAGNLCLRCHLFEVARPATLPQVKLAEHYYGDLCLDCHVAHQPNKSK